MAKSLQELKADYVRQMAEGRAAEDRMIKQLDVNRTRVEQLKGAVFAIDQALAEQKAQADQDAAVLKAAADKAAADKAAADAAAAAALASSNPAPLGMASVPSTETDSSQPANQGA